MAQKRWLALPSVVVLAGCAAFEPRPLVPAQTAGGFEARTLADPGLQTFVEANAPELAKEWPRRSWDLPGLTVVAFYYHPSLDLARAQWGVANAGVKAAAGRPNPTLSITPGYDFSAASGISPWFPGVAFDVPIETAGKRETRITRAEYLAEAARHHVTTVAWQVRSNLRKALTDLTTAERRRGVLREQVEVQQRITELVEQQRRAGAASIAEVAAIRVALTKLQADEADAQRQMTDARTRLAEALGLPFAALEGVRFGFPLEPVWDPSALLDKAEARRLALQQRSDIRAVLAEYEASQAALQLEVAKQYPDLHLGSGYQWDQGDHIHRLRQIHQALGDQQRNVQARLSAGGADQLELQNAKLEVGVSALALLDVEARSSLAAGELEDALQLPFKAPSVAQPQRDTGDT
ncbi:MAG: TolC family protein [Pseudomonadota bacterium]|nr:TolC family protein [Gammaproteobacteria bacterium]MDQ3581035.1 TolC family protein [Pseudomonadota bacterium]